jgi:hypothetical protein
VCTLWFVFNKRLEPRIFEEVKKFQDANYTRELSTVTQVVALGKLFFYFSNKSPGRNA